MQAKYDAYKRYNWQGDPKWQLFLSNLLPVPPIAVLEKRRRRWYKLNIDKEFDVEFEPETNS